MNDRPQELPGTDRRGAAMPVAVLSLVALTLLVTGMLLTSATEVVVSVGQRDAATNLYAAEGAIEAWIATRGADLSPGTVVEWTAPGAAVPVRIEVQRLAAELPGVAPGRHSLYAIQARPAAAPHGRSATVLVRKREDTLPRFAPLVATAVVAGGSSRVAAGTGGGPVVIDGADHPLCHGGDPSAGAAVLLSSDAVLEAGAPDLILGDSLRAAAGGATLAASVLGGISLRDLAWGAEIRFGRYFHEAPLPPGAVVVSGSPDSRLDWGCPADLVESVRAASSAAPRPCASAAAAGRWVFAAIDAGNGHVTLSDHHGQGVVVVLNGDLHLTGGFVFRGLILAERRILVSGGGAGWPPSVDGALVAVDGVQIDPALTPPGLGTAGHRAVRFDRCAVDRAVQAVESAGGERWRAAGVLGRSFGWFEVIR
jgi:hypothetical protein